ncbi:MAG: hypothetical protein ACQEUZ_14155 [Pseudomonadota bacterium]
MEKIAIRVRPNTGEIYLLDRADSGKFELGDPKNGNVKHYSQHKVLVDTVEEAIELILRGFHPRMRGLDTDQFNMISPANVKIIEVPR